RPLLSAHRMARRGRPSSGRAPQATLSWEARHAGRAATRDLGAARSCRTLRCGPAPIPSTLGGARRGQPLWRDGARGSDAGQGSLVPPHPPIGDGSRGAGRLCLSRGVANSRTTGRMAAPHARRCSARRPHGWTGRANTDDAIAGRGRALINTLLIANRGEIACRVIRTARAMRIRTVAVFSDADAKALHVRQADEAMHIGPSPAAESYLRGDRIIEAAKASGAEAIHPGYGFLSENAEFAEAVAEAGLIWVGPRPESIRAMGLKDAAKKLMQEAGVPVTPGYTEEDQSPERLLKEAEAIGWPVLIKAVAGGGGKGMRKVESAPDFLPALESCRREAAASFGNDAVILEKWITSPRHIEVQVFGDTHGNVVHLFERDCSLQRRHQKVIEEAPAPGMDEVTRQAICAAAVRAAKAVDYVGAGTIEFIADASEGLSADRIFF